MSSPLHVEHRGPDLLDHLADVEGAQAPAANTRQVPRPRVPIRPLDDGRHQARCQHCEWTATSSSTVRAEIEGDTAYHRDQHRRGALEVTR